MERVKDIALNEDIFFNNALYFCVLFLFCEKPTITFVDNWFEQTNINTKNNKRK